MTRKKPTISTASVVREYIDTHPSIKDGMQMGITQAPQTGASLVVGPCADPHPSGIMLSRPSKSEVLA